MQQLLLKNRINDKLHAKVNEHLSAASRDVKIRERN